MSCFQACSCLTIIRKMSLILICFHYFQILSFTAAYLLLLHSSYTPYIIFHFIPLLHVCLLSVHPNTLDCRHLQLSSPPSLSIYHLPPEKIFIYLIFSAYFPLLPSPKASVYLLEGWGWGRSWPGSAADLRLTRGKIAEFSSSHHLGDHKEMKLKRDEISSRGWIKKLQGFILNLVIVRTEILFLDAIAIKIHL